MGPPMLEDEEGKYRDVGISLPNSRAASFLLISSTLLVILQLEASPPDTLGYLASTLPLKGPFISDLLNSPRIPSPASPR